MDGRRADLAKAEAGMEGVGSGVGGIGVHLAGDDCMVGLLRVADQILIEASGMASSASRGRNYDAVHINETGIMPAEPQEVGAVVIGILIEGDDECVNRTNAPCVERALQKLHQSLGFEP